MKKRISRFISICLTLGIVLGCTVNVSAEEIEIPKFPPIEEMGVTVKSTYPDSIKVGQYLDGEFIFEGLLPKEEINIRSPHMLKGHLIIPSVWVYDGWNGGWETCLRTSDENGVYHTVSENSLVYAPGTIEFQPGWCSRVVDFEGNYVNRCPFNYNYCENGYSQIQEGDKEIFGIYANTVRSITVETPIIIHNAPASVKKGNSIQLNTEITNTAYENQTIEDRGDNKPFYTPVVEVMEGNGIVSQSKQDYTHTLTTSETLTFNQAGTVKLKVTYRPTVYQTIKDGGHGYETLEEYMELNHPDVDYEIYDEDTILYHLDGEIEEIITINVTDDGSSTTQPPVNITDQNTGIKLEAAAGVVPADTTLKVEQVKEGGNFTIINNALKKTSDKWVAYDISLLSNGVEIQPNGNVKISIPRPRGLNMNKMVLYHVAEDGKLTQIPFTLDGTKDNILFETDHFSLYAVMEENGGAGGTSSTGAVSTPGNNNPQTGENTHVGIFLALGIASAGTMLILTVNKKRRHPAK